MNQKSGIQIGKKAFIQSVVILLTLMIGAGILTRIIPAGSYARSEVDGREIVLADSFEYTDRPNYAVWRWLIAPIEVLSSENALTVIVISLFILIVGASFAVLERSGLLSAGIAAVVQRFGQRKYLLLFVVSFLFMCLGAFFGIFEEVVPLVPLIIALAYYLGWDPFVGLGMSILATNIGFSAAITNPFTIGVAQEIAGLPLFSGAGYRLIIFFASYLVFAIFLARYAKRVERDPKISPVYAESVSDRAKYAGLNLSTLSNQNTKIKPAAIWFLGFVVLMMAVVIASPFISGLSDLALPLVGILFLIGGLGAGFLSGIPGKEIWQAFWEGILGIAPGILLIFMAVSVNYIIVQGKVMDTILHGAANIFSNTSSLLAAPLIYFLALFIEFFISSGSAKAFLMMPVLVPLADLVGVTRQVVVTAYCFGDGFSNLVYPTSAVLLIVLGLTVISYPKWLKWMLKLWFWMFLLTIFFLVVAVVIHYGPF